MKKLNITANWHSTPGVKMWLTLGKLALKTGAEIYRNKKRLKLLESEAEVKHLERA